MPKITFTVKDTKYSIDEYGYVRLNGMRDIIHYTGLPEQLRIAATNALIKHRETREHAARTIGACHK